jgi:hypothetical protein
MVDVNIIIAAAAIVSPIVSVALVQWRNGRSTARWTGSVQTSIEGMTKNIDEVKDDVKGILIHGCPTAKRIEDRVELLERPPT